MTSILSATAQAAHAWTTSLLSPSQIKADDTLPVAEVKLSAPDKTDTIDFKEKGKVLILGVPGAFTGTCHAQVPKYITALDKFKAKGITEIYVVAVNDYFVIKAWKENLAPEGTPVTFLADDKASFVSSLGLILDATPLLGGPRAKRFVIIADGGKVESVTVEENPGVVTGTDADAILAALA